MYYAYARLAMEWGSLDRVYDEEYFNSRLREFGFELRDQPNNAPTAGLIYMPVAWLPPVPAKIVWSGVSLLALAFALRVLLGINGIRPSGTVGLWLLTLVFLWRPAYDTVAFGQVYFVLLLLFALSMKSMLRGGAAGTAIPLALAVLMKGYGLVPVLFLAIQKRWKEIALCAATAACVVIVTLPLLGGTSWAQFFSAVLPSLGRLPPHAHVAYQTINGLMRHLFTYDPGWLPSPAVVLPEFIVTALAFSLSAALIGFVLVRSRRVSARGKLLAYSAALACSVVTAPLAEEYHFVLFIPLIVALAAVIATPKAPGNRRGFGTLIPGIAVLVLAAPINYKALQYTSFPAVLLAYPKLYAGLAILWYACAVMKDTDMGENGKAPREMTAGGPVAENDH
jgi:hypothetical protein